MCLGVCCVRFYDDPNQLTKAAVATLMISSLQKDI